MRDTAEFMVSSLRNLFDMLLAKGGYIGIAVVCLPLFSRIVAAVRSIIKK